jgi:hypothetical protein
MDSYSLRYSLQQPPTSIQGWHYTAETKNDFNSNFRGVNDSTEIVSGVNDTAEI